MPAFSGLLKKFFLYILRSLYANLGGRARIQWKVQWKSACMTITRPETALGPIGPVDWAQLFSVWLPQWGLDCATSAWSFFFTNFFSPRNSTSSDFRF